MRPRSLSRQAILGASWLLGVMSAPATAARLDRLEHVRIPFVENHGEFPDRVAFSVATSFGMVTVERDGRLSYLLMEDGSTTGWTLAETFIGGRALPSAGPRASASVSYFLGSDSRSWKASLPTHEVIRLGEVWPGVSVSLRATAGSVEKTFTVMPGAHVEKISLRVGGVQALRIDRGALLAPAAVGEVRFAAPMAYQERRGVRRPVSVAYVLRGSVYGFRVGAYDRTLPLVVDPVLQSTYVGGANPDSVNAIAVDPKSGDVLVAGHTFSRSFPGAAGSNAGGVDGFVARFDASLTAVKQVTYLGGRGKDQIFGIAVHPGSGEVLVVGFTSSPDFPGTSGGGAPGGGGFVARLDSGLTLQRAVYVGGAQILGIAIHPSNGDVYVAGQAGSIDLRTIGGAQQAPAGGLDGFIARFDPTLATLLQATYLGGTGGGTDADLLRAIAIHPSTGEIYVGGQTQSGNFPGVSGGAQPEPLSDSWNGFLARLDPTLTRLLQSTYLGGGDRGGDDIRALAIDPTSGDVFVTGWTGQPDFPKTAGGAQPTPGTPGGNVDGFVARLSADLKNLRQATYLGGSGGDLLYGIAIDESRGDVYVTGETFSTDLPATAGTAQPAYAGGGDGLIARLDSRLTTILQATYVGGSKGDTLKAIVILSQSGDVLVAGMTTSADLPGRSGGAQPNYAGGSEFFGGDGFVSRYSANLGAGGTPPASSSIRRR